jgi:hypothetical protein
MPSLKRSSGMRSKLLTYLRLTDKRIGLLINFNSRLIRGDRLRRSPVRRRRRNDPSVTR